MFSLLILEDSFSTCIFFIATSCLNALFIYLLVKRCCYRPFRHKTMDNKIVNFLNEQAENHPWRTVIITRILSLPDGLKNYFLCLIKLPLNVYFVSAFIDYTITGFGLAILNEVKNIDELIEKKSLFGQKNVYASIFYVSGIVMLIITVVFVIGFGFYITQFVKSKKEEIVAKGKELNICKD